MEYIFLAIVILSLIVLIFIYNSIFRHHNNVKRAWSDVLTQERQRGRIIPELEKILQEHKAYEAGIQEKITALRTRIESLNDGVINPKAQDEVVETHKELMRELSVTVENYPELKASQSFSQYMSEISNQEANVGAAMRIFNRNVADFNSLIQGFPGNIINAKLNQKKIIEEFSDTEASKSFEYKPKFD